MNWRACERSPRPKYPARQRAAIVQFPRRHGLLNGITPLISQAIGETLSPEKLSQAIQPR